MNTLRSTLLALMFCALVALAAPAQKKTNEESALPRYDPAQEVKVKGEVLDVKEYNCPVSGGMGAHLVLQTAEGQLEVHLALTSFLSDYGIVLAKGDKLEIVGNKITFHDMPAMLVRKIMKDGNEYAFRDDKGKPLWVPRPVAKQPKR